MGRIDRYNLGLFFGFFLGAMLILVTLFVTVDAMSTTLRNQPSMSSVAMFYLYSIPTIAYQMLPVACLFSVVFTLGVLSRNNELVALFSLGMSLARICTPMLAGVLLISALAFWFNDRVTPLLNQRKSFVYYTQIIKQPGLYSTVKDNKIWYRSKNMLFYLKTLQADTGQGQGLTMYFMDSNWRLAQMITAHDVKMAGSNWSLKKGTVTLFTQDSSAPMTTEFDTKAIAVADDVRDLQTSSPSVDTLSVGGLRRYIQRNKEAGLNTLRSEVDYHSRFGFAFAGFVMAFLGIPFSVARQRSGGSVAQVGITLLLAFVYWSFYSSGLAMGQHGYVSPFIGAWIANVATVAATMFFILRLRR